MAPRPLCSAQPTRLPLCLDAAPDTPCVAATQQLCSGAPRLLAAPPMHTARMFTGVRFTHPTHTYRALTRQRRRRHKRTRSLPSGSQWPRRPSPQSHSHYCPEPTTCLHLDSYSHNDAQTQTRICRATEGCVGACTHVHTHSGQGTQSPREVPKNAWGQLHPPALLSPGSAPGGPKVEAYV